MAEASAAAAAAAVVVATILVDECSNVTCHDNVSDGNVTASIPMER